MGPIWGRQDPGGPRVGPWTLYLGCSLIEDSSRKYKSVNATYYLVGMICYEYRLMTAYCWLDTCDCSQISKKFNQNVTIFCQENSFWNVFRKMAAICFGISWQFRNLFRIYYIGDLSDHRSLIGDDKHMHPFISYWKKIFFEIQYPHGLEKLFWWRKVHTPSP